MSKEMDKSEMISIAKRAIEKKWDFEDLKYGDDLYGRESFTDEVWNLVEECEAIGTVAFDEKYKSETPK